MARSYTVSLQRLESEWSAIHTVVAVRSSHKDNNIEDVNVPRTEYMHSSVSNHA